MMLTTKMVTPFGKCEQNLLITKDEREDYGPAIYIKIVNTWIEPLSQSSTNVCKIHLGKEQVKELIEKLQTIVDQMPDYKQEP